MRIAIIIPVYNEESNIEKLFIKMKQFDKKDIIVVDDGSRDNTVAIVKRLGAILLEHKINKGKGMAHRTGFAFAVKQGYDGIITMDGDGQHNPDEIEKFLKSVNYADILIGTRDMTLANMPIDRYLTNKVTTLVVSLIASQKVYDSQSGFRYISSEVLKKVPLVTSRFQTESEMLIKAGRMGFRIGRVRISTIYKEETSYINPVVDTWRFISLAVRSLFE